MGRLTFKIGDTAKVQILVRDAARVAIDITAYTSIKVKISKSLDIADVDAEYFGTVLAVDFSNPTDGYHVWNAAAAVTALWEPGQYLFQVQITDASGVVTSTQIQECDIVKNLID